jgi:xanthine dehydrogenase accessory factor
MPAIILIRGGGDLASGVALRLFHAGLNIVITELPQPLAVRRAVSFSEAIYEGQTTVEDVTGRAVVDPADMLKILNILGKRQIPVVVDPDCSVAQTLHPLAIIDGRMRKQPPEPLTHHAALYLGLGPGFTAPTNCHAVIETRRGHSLGRVIWNGAARDDTSQPEGDPRRVLRAPTDGILQSKARVGDHFELGQAIAAINDDVIAAPFAGILRGIIHPGLAVRSGMKIGDLDPRDQRDYCFTVSDKALAVGGGVLEALLVRPELRGKLWA